MVKLDTVFDLLESLQLENDFLRRELLKEKQEHLQTMQELVNKIKTQIKIGVY